MASALIGSAARIRVVHFPDLPEGGDVSDFIEREGYDELWARVAAAESIRIDASDEASLVGEPIPGPSSIRPTPFTWRDPTSIPPRRWLYGRHYVRSYVTATVSPGGVGKSSLAMVEVAAMVVGRPLLGHRVQRPLRVWVLNLEDPRDEIERRFAAICLQHRIGKQDVGDRLFLDSGRDTPLVLAAKAGDKITLNEAALAEIEGQIVANQIDLLVLDPFVSAHRVPENDNGAIDVVVKALARLADRTACGVELIHHTRKPSAGVAAEYTVDDARGAGSLIGAVRSARVLNPMSKEDAEKAGIPMEERRLHFRVDDGKANMQPPMESATWRKLVSVDLGNATPDEPSDHVGVVIPWTMPGALDRVTVEHMYEVRRRAGAEEYRSDVRSPRWIGRLAAEVIGDLDHDSEAGRRQIKDILRPWFKSGALKTELRKDGTRHEREYVVPGDLDGGHDASV